MAGGAGDTAVDDQVRAHHEAGVLGRHERNGGVVDRIFSDDRLRRFIGEAILDSVYERVRRAE